MIIMESFREGKGEGEYYEEMLIELLQIIFPEFQSSTLVFIAGPVSSMYVTLDPRTWNGGCGKRAPQHWAATQPYVYTRLRQCQT
jgi:hypothetical protein